MDGVACLSFSPNSQHLLAACMDFDHRVLIYNMVNGALLYYAKGDRLRIYDCVWRSDLDFVTAGLGHFKNWKISDSNLKD